MLQKQPYVAKIALPLYFVNNALHLLLEWELPHFPGGTA
jgi:hypothetical protein